MDINTLFYSGGENALIRTVNDVLVSAINVDILSGVVNGWYDTGAYNTMYLTLLGGATITAGAVTIEQTNDPLQATGRPNMYRDAETVAAPPVVSAITVTSGFYKQYFVPITSRYIRIRVSTAFTGAATGVRAVAVLDEEVVLSDVVNAVSLNGTISANIATVTANTAHTLNSAATTNATSVKTSAGKINSLVLSNQNAAIRYFKLYAKASAPTVGTDIPIAVIPVPASSSLVVELGIGGLQVATGIAYAITGAITDADATAITAGDFKVAMNYI